jgi:hypothetical protein
LFLLKVHLTFVVFLDHPKSPKHHPHEGDDVVGFDTHVFLESPRFLATILPLVCLLIAKVVVAKVPKSSFVALSLIV